MLAVLCRAMGPRHTGAAFSLPTALKPCLSPARFTAAASFSCAFPKASLFTPQANGPSSLASSRFFATLSPASHSPVDEELEYIERWKAFVFQAPTRAQTLHSAGSAGASGSGTTSVAPAAAQVTDEMTTFECVIPIWCFPSSDEMAKNLSGDSRIKGEEFFQKHPEVLKAAAVGVGDNSISSNGISKLTQDLLSGKGISKREHSQLSWLLSKVLMDSATSIGWYS